MKYLTTDGDTRAYQAARGLYKDGVTSTAPEHLLDTRHFACSHRKQMNSNANVLRMMAGWTVAYRSYIRNRFSLDLSKRCQAEIDSVHGQEAGSFDAVLKKINRCIPAIKNCYGANHALCESHSVCQATDSNNWIKRSSFLPQNFKIDLSRSPNEETLMRCIEYRLSEDALRQTKLNTNTQKVEATNRSLKRSLPKTVTFTRNFPVRAHSAVHSVNNGPGLSIRKLCSAAGCPIPTGGQVDLGLSAQQRLSEIDKQRLVNCLQIEV